MDELQSAARARGIQDGAQMARFMLWVGEEIFEGREEADFKLLASRSLNLAQRFLAQDGQNVAKEGRPA